MPRGQENANNGINPEAQPQPSCPCSRKKLFIIIAIVVCVVLLVVIISLIVVFNNAGGSESDREEGSNNEGGTRGTSFSATEQKELVDAHNWYRRNVTPPAKDMETMIWDNDVAKWAQEWADKCTHGKHGNLQSDFGWMGQTMYASLPRKHLGTAAVNIWWKEVENYDYTTNSWFVTSV